MRSFVTLDERENGSISILTIGLFLVAVAMLTLITNIGSIVVAKRSLVHVTEAAAIRATHELDLGAYYRGDTGVDIPINCEGAFSRVNDELGAWMRSDVEIRRAELHRVEVVDFVCSGNQIQITTSARATLPFRLRGSFLAYVDIRATVAAESIRKK